MEWLGTTFVLAATAALTALAAILAVSFYRFRYWKKRGVPFPRPLPILGNFAPVMFGRKNFMQNIADVAKLYPDASYCGMYMWTQPVLLTWTPEMAKQILCKDFSSFHDRGQSEDEKDPLSRHLFNMSGVQWRNLRNKLSPTFTSGKLKLMLPLMRDVGEELSAVVAAAAKRSEDRELDVALPLTHFATDVIGTCAFGIQCNCLRDNSTEFLVMSRSISQASAGQLVRVLLETIHPKLGQLLPFKFLFPSVHEFFLKLMHDTVEYRERNKVERNDFVQLMMQLRDADLGHLDPENHVTLTPGLMAAQAFIFFLAGLDNVSNTVAFILSRLAADPELQERVAKEVHDTVRQHDGQVTYEALKKMDLAERVLLEGFRLWNPIGALFRKCNATTKVGDVVIEKGVSVMIMAAHMHMDESIFPDPERFDPDRFTEEAVAQRHPYAYLPFGEGPRICIAERFALLETKLALVMMIRDFKFSPGPNFEEKIKVDPKAFFPRPRNGIRLRVEPRGTA